jgi:hypothetical protein
LKIRTDSLEQSIHFKEQYLEGLKKVLSEGNPKQLDTLPLVLGRTSALGPPWHELRPSSLSEP